MNVDRAYSIPTEENPQLRKLQSQLEAVLGAVSLGLVLTDGHGGSLVNPAAALLLDLPSGAGTAAQAEAAIASRRATWRVHRAADMEAPYLDFSAHDGEYWELPDNRGIIQVESRPVIGCGTPGRLWIFTDLSPAWSLSLNLSQSVSTLQVLNRELDREVKRRLDVEEQLREYNAELETRRRAVERRAVQSARLAELLAEEKKQLELSKQESDFLASRDPLTGLMNRRAFEERLRLMIETDTQERAATAIMFIDLDNFKTVNDTLGHEAGDRLLKDVAERLTGMLRDTDLVARFGGDEFVIATSHAEDPGPSGLRLLADRVRDTLQIDLPAEGKVIQVAATIGVAATLEDGTTLQALLQNADQAMYVGKRHGRNAVVFHADLGRQG